MIPDALSARRVQTTVLARAWGNCRANEMEFVEALAAGRDGRLVFLARVCPAGRPACRAHWKPQSSNLQRSRTQRQAARPRRHLLTAAALHTPTLHHTRSQLVVEYTHERSGWVALPPTLCSRLFETRAATPLALELRQIHRRAGVALPADKPLYAAWAGATCAAGFVGVPGGLGRALGLAEGATVAVHPLPDTPSAVSVTVEPASEDDWEVVQLNAAYLEEQLLNQVRSEGGRRWRVWRGWRLAGGPWL